MGKPTGFKEFPRKGMPGRDPLMRLNDWYEIYHRLPEPELKRQGARCMDCGTPFCQADTGCPIDNLIPEWNDLVYRGLWKEAYERLMATNNFPEFTGRICPAPCESACVLGINEPPVTIKGIEVAIIDRAFQEGWVKPTPPQHRTGKTVAVVGSGPAGLAAADQLNKAGHRVTVFERDDRIGGLLMYGVPNMKLDKGVVQRRVDLLADEGIEFRTGVAVGEADYPVDRLRADFDAVVLACGALKGRDLYVDGRDLGGVHFAMNYLKQSTKRLLDSPEGKPIPPDQLPPEAITATGKHVVVIGGGDTGADCIGTALREGCQSLLNITRRPREPEERDEEHPWPGPPGVYQLDYSHAEGQARFGRDPREYAVLPLGFLGDENGNVRAVQIERLQWEKDPKTGRMVRQNTGRIDELPAELVLLSIGFTGHDTPQLVTDLGLELDGELVRAGYGKFATNVEGVFAAGDMRRGASLIVWAIAEGRGVAKAVDTYLMGHSELPTPQMDEEPTGSGEFDLIGS